jgi:hypothetical protein
MLLDPRKDVAGVALSPNGVTIIERSSSMEDDQTSKTSSRAQNKRNLRRPFLYKATSLAAGRRLLLRNVVVVEAPPALPDPAVTAQNEYKEKQEKYKQERDAYVESYKSERNRLIETKTDQSKSYDQSILTFSAGAIALSITFVEKIAPAPSVPWLLYVAWSFFGFAVLSVIISFLVSHDAFQLEIDAVDAKLAALREAEERAARGEISTEGPKPTAGRNRFTAYTRKINFASGGLFVGGIVFFVLFGIFNWPAKKDGSKIAEKPIKIEITGEMMPDKLNVMTTTGASIEARRGNPPTPAIQVPAPQPPPAPAPAPPTTTHK